jgi:hypothetical protein
VIEASRLISSRRSLGLISLVVLLDFDPRIDEAARLLVECRRVISVLGTREFLLNTLVETRSL